MTPELMAALDRTQTSSRNAVYLLSETAASLGHDGDSLNISRNSIQRARSKSRVLTTTEFSAVIPLTMHWDGKVMAELTTKEQVDRLPVLIPGVATEQLLDVPKLSSGTAEAQAAAVVQLVK